MGTEGTCHLEGCLTISAKEQQLSNGKPLSVLPHPCTSLVLWQLSRPLVRFSLTQWARPTVFLSVCSIINSTRTGYEQVADA